MTDKQQAKSRRTWWRWTRRMLIALATILVLNLIPLAGALIECRVWQQVDTPQSSANQWSDYVADLEEYARREDQTYLTLPEWYIVFNADEYALHLAEKRPSSFPHFRAIGQYWRTYYGACRELRGNYPFNTEYQVIVGVISVSFTIESAVRGLYENTVGRLAEWVSTDEPTAEEIYAQQVATAYGSFIHRIPWFRFPFGEKFSGLWRETSLWGPNPIRKWERKLALSVEYGIKAGYGWLLGMGRDASFAPVTLETQFVGTGITDDLLAQEPDLRVIKRIDDTYVIAGVPRYEDFTLIVPRLVEHGVAFAEIAGNDEIMLTAFAPGEWIYNLNTGNVLYAMPVLIAPEQKRLYVKVPVESLHAVLLEFAHQGVKLEHLYDY